MSHQFDPVQAPVIRELPLRGRSSWMTLFLGILGGFIGMSLILLAVQLSADHAQLQQITLQLNTLIQVLQKAGTLK